MKKNIDKWFLKFISLLALLTYQACETVDFGNENLNPNSPAVASTSALLTNAQRSIPTIVSEVNSNLMVQYISEITYTEDSRYEQFEWSYDRWYSGPLKDLQEIIDLNTTNPDLYKSSGTTENQIAIARILKAYFFLYLTDRWGMIPYSEALKGSENIKPKFDSQEFIYNSLFDEIDMSLGLINEGGSIKGDILFGGDLVKWKKFANTMKLIMAMRVSNINPSLGKEKLLEALDSGVILGSDENLHYPYLTEDTNDNPWQDRFQTREDYAVSNVFIDFLNENNDPRISAFAELPQSDSSGTYVGCPYGVANPNILQSDMSFITSDIIYDGTKKGGVIFTFAQVCFSLAEAYQRGMLTDDDNQGPVGPVGYPLMDSPEILQDLFPYDMDELWYYVGIGASMGQWGISRSESVEYMNQPNILYDKTTGIEQIATQKWISLYMQGAEAWAEWRRLDFPHLEPAVDALSGNGIPVRNGYAALTKSLNEESYKNAVSIQGPDNQDTRLWWDIK